MATKTYLPHLFLILFTLTVSAKTDEQQLAQWTIENEKKLLIDYEIIPSKWFEQTCLSLVNSMHFNQINQCKLFKSDFINAYVFDNGHVYFSTAMMALINNKHQWAAILAHENAHIELQHYLKTLKKIKKPGIFFPKRKIRALIKNHEQAADDWSKIKLHEFGYEYIQIVYFFQRVKSKQGENQNKTHLKLSKRVNITNQPEIVDKPLVSQISQLQ